MAKISGHEVMALNSSTLAILVLVYTIVVASISIRRMAPDAILAL
jgi:hypothetical protein